MADVDRLLQRLERDGLAFIHAGGTIIKRDLAAGQTLPVDTGWVAVFAPTVDHDIQFIGGFPDALFGGEGIFLARLPGPGPVYLPSLPLSRPADRMHTAIGARVGEKKGVAGLSQSVLGGILGGD